MLIVFFTKVLLLELDTPILPTHQNLAKERTKNIFVHTDVADRKSFEQLELCVFFLR